MTKYWISRSCEGERCNFRQSCGCITKTEPCGAPAAHKVEEDIAPDDPFKARHPLTAYLCAPHYDAVMGPMAERTRQLHLAALDPPE